MSSVPKQPDEDGISYLLAEYDFIANFRESQIQAADRRVDVLLTLASAFIAGITVLFSVAEKMDFRALLLGTTIAGAVVLCLGLITFGHILHLTISTVEHTRAINRIRYFFTQHSPFIQPYVMLPVSHKHPPYNMRAGGRRIIAVIDSTCAAISAACFFLAVAVWNQIAPYANLANISIAATVALIVFSCSYVLHEAYAHRLFATTEARASSVRSEDEFLYGSTERIS